MLLQHLAERLSLGWDKSYGHILMWIWACLAFAVIWETNLCLHGSHVPWCSATSIDDGTSLPDGSLAYCD